MPKKWVPALPPVGRDDEGWRGVKKLATEALFCICSSMRNSWVYIVTNKRNGTLYTGVTSDLVTRIWQHRHGYYAGFSRKYGCMRLVWFETHDDIREAIAREKRLKRWRRAWKLKLIEADNPDWRDLYDELVGWVPDSACGASGMTKIEIEAESFRHPGFRESERWGPGPG